LDLSKIDIENDINLDNKFNKNIKIISSKNNYQSYPKISEKDFNGTKNILNSHNIILTSEIKERLKSNNVLLHTPISVLFEPKNNI